IRTNYGNYQYEITGTKITDNEDRSAYDLAKNEENLIMYTCYPFDTLGLTNLRAFIYAKYVSGPVIDKTS
ncbi:MAG: sortase, partial [Lachnospiraceae bacterium]|nr:sortase [Lachnospiraceae bacterium]